MKTIKIYFLLIIASLVIGACSKTADQSKIKEGPKGLNIENGMIKISKEKFEDEDLALTSLVEIASGETVNSTGLIEVPPNGRAVITAQIGGYIKNSPLLVGDKVKKGQFLISLENIEFLEFQQQYLEAKEKLGFLKSEYERQQELYKEKITSQKSFLKAESEYKTTLALYLGLKKKLELLNIDISGVEKGMLSSEVKIYSPITGDIAEIEVKSGSPVGPADVIMEIVSTEHLHLELRVFEKDMLKLKIGQKVLFSIPESNDKTYPGKVHLIGKTIGTDRTVKVHVHIDEPYDKGFIPGMFVQSKILIDENQSTAILKDAVIQTEGKFYVFLLDAQEENDYIFKQVEVQAGIIKDGLQIIEFKGNGPSDFQFLDRATDLFTK